MSRRKVSAVEKKQWRGRDIEISSLALMKWSGKEGVYANVIFEQRPS